jgi:hypothetical protein
MVKSLCCARTEHGFDERKKELDKHLNTQAKAWLEEHMQHKSKWALAFHAGVVIGMAL